MRRLLAVLGRDVSGSLSPRLHAAAAAALGLDVAYVPVSCADPAGFGEAVRALRVLRARGANVTIPYKLDALALSTSLGAEARAIGAVNTLTFEGDEVLGDNTDGPGLARVLRGLGPAALEHVAVLGAGGSARAAVWAAREVGARRVSIVARRPEAARALADALGGAPASPAERVDASAVVSCLPVDAAGADPGAWVDLAARPSLVDLAYAGPAGVTPLVRAALARSLVALDGRALLVEQAALALARWTGADPEALRIPMRAEVGLPRDPLL